ncbi:lysyl oxidase family protein [Pseudonocardia sulfidoxydans]|uniref:lysyl oxidase family protein n=1 Tax=Pseudonocardia sulfidoxydans TaxID=54011 RepID=UPI0036173B74
MRQVRLRFTSSEENVGDGPLLLYGHRDSTATPTMAVRQALQRVRTSRCRRRSRRRSARSRGRRCTTSRRRCTCTGTCWRSTVPAGGRRRPYGGVGPQERVLPGRPVRHRHHRHVGAHPADDGSPQTVLADELAANDCRMHHPEALDVAEGISVGSGDNYDYTVDYQWLDVTAVPSGTYTLVNTVNPDRRILEKDYENNSSSIVVSIEWPGGGAAPRTVTAPPEVHLLRSCPGHETCSEADAW